MKNPARIVVHYTRLVKSIAYSISKKLPAHIELDDLIQVGMIGLLECLPKYREQEGVKLVNYVSYRVRGSIIDYLRSTDSLPRRVRFHLKQIKDKAALLQGELARPPTDAEVATALGWTIEVYHKHKKWSGHSHISSDDMLFELMEVTSSDPLEKLLRTGTDGEVVLALGCLTSREQAVLQMYYEDDLSMQEIGDKIGTTLSRVSQLHSAAIKKLRVTLQRMNYAPYD